MNTMDIIDSNIDPWDVLGIQKDSDDTVIEQAWRAKISARKNLDKVHLAYKMIANAEDRARYALLLPGIPESLEGIQDQMPVRSRFSGPGVWYKSLKTIIENQE